MREHASPNHETACQEIVQFTLDSLKIGDGGYERL